MQPLPAPRLSNSRAVLNTARVLILIEAVDSNACWHLVLPPPLPSFDMTVNWLSHEHSQLNRKSVVIRIIQVKITFIFWVKSRA